MYLKNTHPRHANGSVDSLDMLDMDTVLMEVTSHNTCLSPIASCRIDTLSSIVQKTLATAENCFCDGRRHGVLRRPSVLLQTRSFPCMHTVQLGHYIAAWLWCSVCAQSVSAAAAPVAAPAVACPGARSGGDLHLCAGGDLLTLRLPARGAPAAPSPLSAMRSP
jgi:hypothetical protein